jgi:fimbrial chaperone protein
MIKYSLRFIVLLFCSLPVLVYAGSLQIQPVQVNLSQQQPITSLTLTNSGSSPMIVQASVKRWEQKNGNNSYEKTSDLLVTPPIMTIAPHVTQIIRLGLTNAPNSQQELAYRLYLQEVPPYHEPNSKHKGVLVLLRIGIPVFVAPLVATAQPDLHWQLQRINVKQVRLRLTNNGNAHAKITELTLSQQGRSKPLLTQPTLSYVLPQQSFTWLLNIPAVAGQELELTANTGNGDVKTALRISAA